MRSTPPFGIALATLHFISAPVPFVQRQIISTQHLFRLSRDRFITFSLESGHYSNGQVGCSFDNKIQDDTPACDSIYSLITPQTNLSDLLNRKNGNFTTNLTEVIVNYRLNRLGEDMILNRVHSFRIGLTFYHKNILGMFPFGGYSDADIKLYGLIRYQVGYECIRTLSSGKRISIAENIELIQDAHPSVNPIRSDLRFTFYA